MARNTRLKVDHTARVRLHMINLVREQGLSPPSVAIAEAIALLHDIGRFEQYQRYQTFNDDISVDHGACGLEVIDRESCLTDFSDEEQELIRTGVAFHNKLQIPDHLDELSILLVKLIRDADKLDIMQLILNDYEKEPASRNPAIDLDMPETEGYQNYYLDEIYKNRIVDRRFIHNVNDLRLVRLSWIFDLHFKYSFLYTEKIMFVDKMTSRLPGSPEIEEVKCYLRDFITSKTTHVDIGN
ncbi:HD domain-containing protein [Thermodesulfobacteriota bacterium]